MYIYAIFKYKISQVIDYCKIFITSFKKDLFAICWQKAPVVEDL